MIMMLYVIASLMDLHMNKGNKSNSKKKLIVVKYKRIILDQIWYGDNDINKMYLNVEHKYIWILPMNLKLKLNWFYKLLKLNTNDINETDIRKIKNKLFVCIVIYLFIHSEIVLQY